MLSQIYDVTKPKSIVETILIDATNENHWSTSDSMQNALNINDKNYFKMYFGNETHIAGDQTVKS